MPLAPYHWWFTSRYVETDSFTVEWKRSPNSYDDEELSSSFFTTCVFVCDCSRSNVWLFERERFWMSHASSLCLTPTPFPSQPAGSAFCCARKAPLSHVIEILHPEVGGYPVCLWFGVRLEVSLLSVDNSLRLKDWEHLVYDVLHEYLHAFHFHFIKLSKLNSI